MVNHDRYASIKNIFRRDHDTEKIIMGDYSLPEFEYLQDCKWIWTEKLEGMNIRAILDRDVKFRSRGSKEGVPGRLMKHLRDILDTEKIRQEVSQYYGGLCLYGEGIGAGIRKGGRYGPSQYFVLFDVQASYGWASHRDMSDIAKHLHIPKVPTRLVGTPDDAIFMVSQGLKSYYGDFFAEGLVGRPLSNLRSTYGQRIITKIKHSDFYQGNSVC